MAIRPNHRRVLLEREAIHDPYMGKSMPGSMRYMLCTTLGIKNIRQVRK